MINSIQFLRAVAALMVLFFHSSTMVSERAGYGQPFANTGAAGVDIFFIISGFVIFLVSQKNYAAPNEFLAKRLIRVAPPYWFYTTLSLVLLFIPGVYKNMKPELTPIISSYLFLLSRNGNGDVGTILGVGWTIAFEMYFYAVFYVSMRLMPAAPLRLVVAIIATGVALSGLVSEPPPFALVPLSALPLEFLAGCAIAQLHLRGIYLNRTGGVVAIIVGAFCIWYSGAADWVAYDRDPWRVLYWGVPSALLVYGFLSIDVAKLVKFPRLGLFLGNASYSIYLCHQFVLIAIGKAWAVAGLKNFVPATVVIFIGIFAATAAGAISYWFFEKPVTNWLNSAFHMRRSKKQAAVLS